MNANGTEQGTGREIWLHPDGGRYVVEGSRKGKDRATGEWIDGVDYHDLQTGERFWTAVERWIERFTPTGSFEPIAVDDELQRLRGAVYAIAHHWDDSDDEKAIVRGILDKHGVTPTAPDSAVHVAHCNWGDYIGVCKYGDDDSCPALGR